MICLNCSKEFSGHKRKYCNRVCSKRYSYRKAHGEDISVYELIPTTNNKPNILNCLTCHKAFRRTNNGGSDGRQYTRFCSRKCGWSHSDLIHNEVSSIKRIHANSNKPKGVRLAAYIKSKREPVELAHKYSLRNHCRKCGGDIVQMNSQNCTRRCDKCKRETTANNRVKFATPGRDKGRAEYYGVEYEYINRYKVFTDHGWLCNHCGVNTPRELKGKYEPNSPELDHIIPISKGGPHTYINVQLLCRKCNGSKGNRFSF